MWIESSSETTERTFITPWGNPQNDYELSLIYTQTAKGECKRTSVVGNVMCESMRKCDAA
jgi:hypothetical protein